MQGIVILCQRHAVGKSQHRARTVWYTLRLLKWIRHADRLMEPSRNALILREEELYQTLGKGLDRVSGRGRQNSRTGSRVAYSDSMGCFMFRKDHYTKFGLLRSDLIKGPWRYRRVIFSRVNFSIEESAGHEYPWL